MSLATKMLHQLKREKEALDHTITALEHLSRQQARAEEEAGSANRLSSSEAHRKTKKLDKS